jgi:predicted outer membrane repeat protein
MDVNKQNLLERRTIMIIRCLQNKGRTSMLIFAALIVAASSARPANADKIVLCTRGEFIAAVLAGGDVTFDCGPDPHTIELISVIEISRDVTINGGGKITLKASDTNHFKVPPGKNLVLKDINLINGKASKGGAIESLGTLSAFGVTFANNTATDEGGAILNTGALSVSGSRFLDNSAGTRGGALASHGDTTVELSTFSGNEARGIGGAIFSAANLKVDRSTLIGNQAKASSGGGGGIAYLPNPIGNLLMVTESTLNGNRAIEGGGIYARGDAIYTNSTLSGNESSGLGGALYHQAGRSFMRFMTVANNLSKSARTGGIHTEFGTLSLQNTLLSNPSVAGSSFNCSGDTFEIVSLGNNLSSDDSCRESFVAAGDKNNVDAKLGRLDNNGGPTRTHLPQADSPALDAAAMVDGITTDQRRLPRPRPRGGRPDIGSVEVQ